MPTSLSTPPSAVVSSVSERIMFFSLSRRQSEPMKDLPSAIWMRYVLESVARSRATAGVSLTSVMTGREGEKAPGVAG